MKTRKSTVSAKRAQIALRSAIIAVCAAQSFLGLELTSHAQTGSDSVPESNLNIRKARAVSSFERGDYAAALVDIKWLVSQDDALGQAYLGKMYEGGLGLAQDDVRAARWFHLAAEQGDASAQARLGRMYFTGRGCGARCFSKPPFGSGCLRSRDSGKHRRHLVTCIKLVRGVTRNDVEAFRWFRLAAEQGHANSQASLGLMYKNGWGTRPRRCRGLSLV